MKITVNMPADWLSSAKFSRRQASCVNSLVLLATLLFAAPCFSFGLADWRDITPGGNTINDAGGTDLWLRNGAEIEDVHSWYFYKGYIIGKVGTQKPESYFAVDEKRLRMRLFRTESEFEAFLDSHDLKPALWTRWYQYRWSFTWDDFAMMLAFGFIITIPLLIIFGVILYRAIVREKLSPRRIHTQIVAALGIYTLVKLVLVNFPQSI